MLRMRAVLGGFWLRNPPAQPFRQSVPCQPGGNPRQQPVGTTRLPQQQHRHLEVKTGQQRRIAIHIDGLQGQRQGRSKGSKPLGQTFAEAAPPTGDQHQQRPFRHGAQDRIPSRPRDGIATAAAG